MKKFVGIIVCIMCFLGLSQAQKGYELGPWLGVSNYFGELNTDYRLTDVGPAIGFGARYNFGHRICLKGSLNYGYIYGSDTKSTNNFERRRNLDFKSHLGDFTATGEFNFLPYTHGSQDEYFTPYLSAGVNIFYYAPFTEFEGDNVFLRPLGTEGQGNGGQYSIINGGLVFGGGFKWDINYLYSFNVEFTYRALFTDYLDDVSGNYPNPAELQATGGDLAVALSDRSVEPKIGFPGSQRGDSTRRDSYTFFGISIMRYFGSIQCPKVSAKKAATW